VGPIRVDQCQAQISRRDHLLELKFKNIGTVAAYVVSLTIGIGTQEFTVRDVGTFSPGVEIDHHFNASIDPWPFLVFSASVPPAECRVMSVDFFDGTHWPLPPTKNSRQAKGSRR
jgi:hypothetical protein